VSKGWRVQSAHFHREDSTLYHSAGIRFFDWLHSQIHSGRRNLMSEYSARTGKFFINKKCELAFVVGLTH
jgi:hypothetical protein